MGLFIIVDLFMNLEELSSIIATGQDRAVHRASTTPNKSLQSSQPVQSVILDRGMFRSPGCRQHELLPLLSAGSPTVRSPAGAVVPFGMMGLAVSIRGRAPQDRSLHAENRQNPRWLEGNDRLKPMYDANGILVTAKVGGPQGTPRQGASWRHPPPSAATHRRLQAKEPDISPPRKTQTPGLAARANQDDPELVTLTREDNLKPLGDGVYFLKTPDATWTA